MKKKYTLAELKARPTLATGQTDDLKIETERQRVWLSRCTTEDGEPYNNRVTVEKLAKGYFTSKRGFYWKVDYTYEAK